MLRTIFCFLLIFIITDSIYAQKTVRGKVTDQNKDPLPGTTIRAFGTTTSVFADVSGEFVITVDDQVKQLEVFFLGYIAQTIEITGDFLNIVLVEDVTDIGDVQVVGYGTSPLSFWYGAKTSYNFVGENDIENFVTSASLKLEQWDLNTERFNLFLTGNIAAFSVQKSEENDKNDNELVQPDRGLSIALSPTYILKQGEIAGNNYRLYAFSNIGFKYNSFKDSDTDSNFNFSQFIFNGGIEFEGLPFNQSDAKPIQLSLTFFSTSFDPDEYELLTGTRKNKLNGASAGIVIPIPGLPLGFSVTNVYQKDEKPIWSVGMIIK